jgi:hypothetical protein
MILILKIKKLDVNKNIKLIRGEGGTLFLSLFFEKYGFERLIKNTSHKDYMGGEKEFILFQ